MVHLIRLLKLVDDDELNSEDNLSLHLGRYLTHGKVAYGTDIPVVAKPKYVLFVLGNVDDICYLCHVAAHAYDVNSFKYHTLDGVFTQFVPDWYKETPHKTWFVFDSMQKISVQRLDQLLSGSSCGPIYEFITSRANNKAIEISDKDLADALNQESCAAE